MLFGHERVIRCPETEESEGDESRATHVDEDGHEASLEVLE